MFGKIASFELRYQLRNPVFWVVAILFFLLAFGAVTVPQVQVGSASNTHKNAPFAIAQMHLIFSIFFMFVTTAFVANVVVRDDESGFAAIVRSTRITKFNYLVGRFTGALLASAVAFLVVPAAIWLGSRMPWLDSESLGPNRWADYAYAYVALALPNVLLTSAIFFTVATMTRSMMYSYACVVIFLVAYLSFNAVIQQVPSARDWIGYVEPFGAAAFNTVTRYWTTAESNNLTPPVDGMLLANRALVVLLSAVVVGVAVSRYSFAQKAVSPRKLRRLAKREAKLAEVMPTLVATLPSPRYSAAALMRMMARIRFEMALVFKSPAFLILMIVGLVNGVVSLIYANEIYGTPAHPLTFALIQSLLGAFAIFPIIIAIYYAGELVWRDRDRKMNEIIDATSLPNWAYLVPKALALSAVLLSSVLISMLASMLVQLARGQMDLELGQYLVWYVLPLTVDMVILAVLAIFIQAISPNKYIGWGAMVIYLVAKLTLANIGFEHPLYDYGSTGTVMLSDMNGDNVGGPTGWWLRLYWSGVALALATLAHLLWRRGTQVSFKARLRRMPTRLVGGAGAALVTGLATAAATGGFIYYNMDVLNQYRTNDDEERLQVDLERKYLRYEFLKQPSVTAVTMKVDLHPREKRLEASGKLALINDTGAPVSDIHIRYPDLETKVVDLRIPGAKLVLDDERLHYRIYHLATPMAVDATSVLTFRLERDQRGFRAEGDDTRIVDNGTFINNFSIMPILGMDQNGLLTDRIKRRKYGLPPELRMPKLEDARGQDRNYVGNADWVMSDITVSTEADQTPIAPGRLVSDQIVGNRRVARFVSGGPILAFFSIQSAHYATQSADLGGGVTGTVFYDAKHAYNVDRMLKAMKLSLDYYRPNFGPYQFDSLRIIEFPGYETFAQSFAGTIPYSERIGFLADASDPDTIDYVTYVTAHEVGHQYWAHQVIPARMQGGTMLSETMAQYSALMVMKRLYGEDKIRRFLKYELDTYLQSRNDEAGEELPLERVENQAYIHYRKGALAMYLMQDRLGEDRVNTMLAGLIRQWKFKSQPYPRSTIVVDGLKSLARNEEERQLIRDLFERITLWDMKATSATVKRLANGWYQTTITVEGGKLYADGKGKEVRAPLGGMMDVGLFAVRPGIGKFSTADVIAFERRPVKSGHQEIVVTSRKKPAYAGIDPYNKFIDRDSDDNVTEVTG